MKIYVGGMKMFYNEMFDCIDILYELNNNNKKMKLLKIAYGKIMIIKIISKLIYLLLLYLILYIFLIS